jgi:C-terminal processing protease CtpA/Prc
VNPVNAAVEANIARIDGPKENVSLRFVGEPSLAVLKIRGFDGETFRAEVEAAVKTLRERGTKALILDLRRNGGGVDEYGAFLVSQFVTEPFRYFDRIHIATLEPSFSTWKPATAERLKNNVVPDPAGGFLATPALHSGVGEQQPAAAPYLAPLFVLIDGGSFSTAADVTAMLRQLKRATFVAEEAGGAYEGNRSGLNADITLPHSKLRYRVQMYGYHNAVTGGEKGRGTRPDEPVPLLAADILRGVDAALDRAISLARAAAGR